MHNGMRKALLGAGVATLAMVLSTQAFAQQRRFDIPAQDAATAVTAFGLQADVQISAPTGQLRGVRTPAVQGEMDARAALQMLLAGTGLVVARDDGRTIVLQMPPQGGSADGGADINAVEALIVTAQKREEAIQDVPIAISAFSQKALEEQKIEGGYDLMKAIPNVTFSKSNFSSYNFSIRGVGTKAISATTDPGVAVAFNNTTLIQNRLFEQEYFDVERVEVLRGPQGTLYGRNATSGVINVISAKPDLGDFEGSLKLEAGNYDSRRAVGMVNVPIIQDILAVRLAGAKTQRSGYDYNSTTQNAVNGRDLWSTRITVGFQPTDNFRGNLVWEHFEEDDDRSRTSKQLCHHDSGREMVGSTVVLPAGMTSVGNTHLLRPHVFSQGCKAGSLYDDAAFGTPNGLALPFIFAIASRNGSAGVVGRDSANVTRSIIDGVVDPYGGLTQSRDLRTIASFRDPRYSAKADLVDLAIDLDLTDNLTLTSQTVYNQDQVYSFQDFNRFNTRPIFTDTSGLTNPFGYGPYPLSDLAPGGVFCDPQVGCSNTLAGFDISQANGKQFSQELRLSSDLDGPLNFSLGANYTRFKTLVDYYVFYNVISVIAQTGLFNRTGDPARCSGNTFIIVRAIDIPITDPNAHCPLVDPNPISEGFDGDGHNYFRSKNPYKLKSTAVFGEVYWDVSDDLKMTAGLRYTNDEKTFIPVPSQVLLAPSNIGGGTVNSGYPELDPIIQNWGEWTGRLGLDWKPVLPFTDDTMVYGFYSRGYKGGGANPPRVRTQ